MRLVFALGVISSPVAAQSITVDGRVFDAVTNGAITNALVTLEGHGELLSNPQGAFRFSRVTAGVYVLRVEAFGYEPFVSSIRVTEDVTVALSMRARAFQLDSLFVPAETHDFDGHVRDARLGSDVMDALILSNQGHEETSNVAGNFDLDDVWEGSSLRITIRSFGYLPLDTTFVPEGDDRHEFELQRDTLVERMILTQNERLEERAGENFYRTRPPLNRDDMVGHLGHGSLRTLTESKYPPGISNRVACVVIDERQVGGLQPVGRVLQNTLPENLERVELLEFVVSVPRGPSTRHVIMLRAYTRIHFQELIARNQPLSRPSMSVDLLGRFTCT